MIVNPGTMQEVMVSYMSKVSIINTETLVISGKYEVSSEYEFLSWNDINKHVFLNFMTEMT